MNLTPKQSLKKAYLKEKVTRSNIELFKKNLGLAFMVGVNNLTVGMGVGWDYLTDRDKSIWIYQKKPWCGLTPGLNLN